MLRLISVERFHSFLRRFPSAKVRLFTEHERKYCERFKRGPDERYAARFAAKCAYRAMRPHTRWQSMEVRNDPLGAPELWIDGETRVPSISLTHEGCWAAASLIMEVDA